MTLEALYSRAGEMGALSACMERLTWWSPRHAVSRVPLHCSSSEVCWAGGECGTEYACRSPVTPRDGSGSGLVGLVESMVASYQLLGGRRSL